ncbi:MAG: DUF6518 family protein [Solirubrobacteraceae bacterium]
MSDSPATRSARGHLADSGPYTEGSRTDAASAVGRAPDPSHVSVRAGTAVRLMLAIVIGLAVGALTEWSVPHLPFSLEPLGNTAGPWVLVAFAVALTARRMGEALMLAVVTLLALVVGFYVVEACRGWGVSRHQVELWSVASVVIGPLVGLAAGWFRHAGRRTAALGAGVLGGVLAGEAVWGLTGLRLSSPADYWHVQFVLGVGLAVGLTGWRSRRYLRASVPALAVSLAAGTVVGLATLGAYHVSR